MARKITLYMFTGSTPSLTARLMLEHKGLDYKRVHVMVGPHAFGMLGRGFQTMTVPALKIDSRRVQGSREISRALDELAPKPLLFPADSQRRQAVSDAERLGEQLQDAARRIFWCAARRDPQAFHNVLRHTNPLMRPAQRVTRGLVTRLATAGHRATDRAGQEDLAALPSKLDQIDAWIKEGLLAGPELNAADFQIAPNIALLLRFEDLAPFIEGRPAAQLAKIAPPERPVQIGGVLPTAWLAPLHAAAARGPQPSPNASHGPPRTTSSEANRTNSPPRHDSALRTSIMPEDTRLHLGVTLDLGADTISGTVQDAANPIIEFTGWLELMSALDTVTDRATKLWPRAKWSKARRSAPVDSRTTHKARDDLPQPDQHADQAPDDQAAAHRRDDRQAQ